MGSLFYICVLFYNKIAKKFTKCVTCIYFTGQI